MAAIGREPKPTNEKSVAVTGANGFVGSALIAHLAWQKTPAIALARSRPHDLPAGTQWRGMPDLASGDPESQALAGVRALIHCAARVHIMRDPAPDPLEAFRRVNRDGTLRLANAAARAGVRHFVFVSSIKVNGEATAPGEPFTPDSEPRPVDPYAVSKAEAEIGLQDIARQTGMLVTIVRPVLVFGPGVKANFAALAAAARAGLPLPLANIANRRSFIFVDNLADLLAEIARGRLPGGRLYLASDGPALSTGELVRSMALAQGRAARLFPFPHGLIATLARLAGRQDVINRLIGSLEVDRQHLEQAGWTPPFSLQHGLERTFRSGI